MDAHVSEPFKGQVADSLLRNHRRRGSLLFVILALSCTLFILGISLATFGDHRRRQSSKHFETLQAIYLSEACMRKALNQMSSLFREPLVLKERAGEQQRVNEPLLDLLDVDRAREWERSIAIDAEEIVPKGRVSARLELLGLETNELGCGIDPLERIPPSLEGYRSPSQGKDDDDFSTYRELGGWSGQIRVVCEAIVGQSHWVIESIRSIQVIDVTPPAPQHSLFISGEDEELLGPGRFVLSNFELPEALHDLLRDLVTRIEERLHEKQEDGSGLRKRLDAVNRLLAGGLGSTSPVDAVLMIRQVSTGLQDRDIADRLDNMILGLNPRTWGRVRSCGTLHVQLPFFAADDVINYIAGDDYFARRHPEVGYLFCENRLHDPYTSGYTRYEGRIFKKFHRVLPDDRIVEAPPQRYTVNTMLNYLRRHPDGSRMPRLERLRSRAKRFHQRQLPKKARLVGMAKEPLHVEGIWYAPGSVEIEGPFVGRGLVVAEGQIRITGDLISADAESRFGLVSLNESIALDGERTHFRVEASLCSAKGLKGTALQSLDLQGNLAVGRLARSAMPRFFRCRYDSQIQSGAARNVTAHIERLPLFRWESARPRK